MQVRQTVEVSVLVTVVSEIDPEMVAVLVTTVSTAMMLDSVTVSTTGGRMLELVPVKVLELLVKLGLLVLLVSASVDVSVARVEWTVEVSVALVDPSVELTVVQGDSS